MKKINLKKLSLLIFIIISFLIFKCQKNKSPLEYDINVSDRIIFSEIYLDNKNQKKNWIELYNPTNKELLMSGGRFSHIRTMNCLPSFYINPFDYFVICADDSIFSSKFKHVPNYFEIEILSEFSKGGFFVIRTKFDSNEVSDVFRYGESSRTDSLEWLAGSDIAPLSFDNDSYSAKIIKIENDINWYKFEKCKPTPGYTNINLF